MGRSHVNTILQPDENTCGPVSIQHALAIFGHKKPLKHITRLCKTTSYGTTTPNMIQALRKLQFSVLSLEKATLHHVLRALQYTPNQPRAVIVSYLYANDNSYDGHWATVCSYSARKSRIVLFDSYSGQRKSYDWETFRSFWKDYELKKKMVSARKFRFVKKWRRRLMLIVSDSPKHLPSFRSRNAAVYTPLRA